MSLLLAGINCRPLDGNKIATGPAHTSESAVPHLWDNVRDLGNSQKGSDCI
jgi:hypothetical protein